jgi:osmotically-inducible protein OsmY
MEKPAQPGEPERQEVTEEAFLAVLDEAIAAVEGAGVKYAVMGGIASAAVGRPRWTLDVDLFVRGQEARRALEALAQAGFDTPETHHNWLYKAVKDGVLVDLIFTARGGIYLDDEMLARSPVVEYKGRRLRLVPPEDLLVMKAIAHDHDTPRYWHDALGIVATSELDWDYLLQRARAGSRRVLSLLLHAQSDDLVVPDAVIKALYELNYEQQWQPGPLPQPGTDEHMVAHVRERLAQDPRVNELNVKVEVEGDRVILSGDVATPERRDTVAKVVGELLTGWRVDNRLSTVEQPEDGHSEQVA